MEYDPAFLKNIKNKFLIIIIHYMYITYVYYITCKHKYNFRLAK